MNWPLALGFSYLAAFAIGLAALRWRHAPWAMRRQAVEGIPED